MKLLMHLFCALAICNASAQKSNPILFEITQEGSDQTSYLFGTMHADTEGMDNIISSVQPFVSSCSVFSGELDLTEPEIDMELMGTMFSSDTTFEMLFDPKEQEEIKAFIAAKAGPTGAMLTTMKPMWISTSLVQLEMDTDPNQIIDVRLQRMGELAGLSIEPLETMEEQFHAINSIPLKEQAAALLDFTRNYDEQMGATEELEKFYILGNLDGMQGLYDEDSFSQAMERSLIHDRNDVMVERLVLKMNEKKSVFCAVGALHLPGEGGLIAQLKSKGYNVNRVIFPAE